MFWNSNAYPMQKALARFRSRYALNADTKDVLSDLINWLGDQYRNSTEWPHDTFIQVLMGADRFDKEAVSKDIKEGLQSLEEFSTTLIDKLESLHATLTFEQRQQIAEDLEKFERVYRQWHGWKCRQRPNHKKVA